MLLNDVVFPPSERRRRMAIHLIPRSNANDPSSLLMMVLFYSVCEKVMQLYGSRGDQYSLAVQSSRKRERGRRRRKGGKRGCAAAGNKLQRHITHCLPCQYRRARASSVKSRPARVFTAFYIQWQGAGLNRTFSLHLS